MQVGDFGDEIQNLFKCSILSSFPDEFLFITELKRFSKFARKIMKTWYKFFGDGLAYPWRSEAVLESWENNGFKILSNG